MEKNLQAFSDGKDSNCATHKHYISNWRNLIRLWKAQKLCDVIVNVKGKTFRCHSIVPASTSPFFRRAFYKKQELSCEGANLDKEIIIDFMKPDLFGKILHFMYTAEIRINPDSARALILAAGRLEIQTMVNVIMRKILQWEKDAMERGESGISRKKDSSAKKKHPWPENSKVRDRHQKRNLKDAKDMKRHYNQNLFNDLSDGDSDAPGPWLESESSTDKIPTVTGIMDELRIQGDMKTLKNVRTFAARQFSEVSKLDSFLSSSVHTMACLLDDERLNVDELHVFLALCKWLEAEHIHLVHAPYLLSKIRLQLLSPSELAEHVETKDYLMRKKKCRVNILEAFRFHCLLSQGSEPGVSASRDTPKRQQPRIGIDSLLSLYRDFITDDEESENEDVQSKKKEDDATKHPMQSCACVPDYILLSGGIDVREKMASDGIFKYEEKENNWFRFAKMPQPRNHHAAVYCKGALYLLGGSDPSLTGPGVEVCPVSTCHKLGLGSLKWSKIDSMSIPRMSLQAVYMSGYIYAIGGQDHKQRILGETERYSLSKGTWEHIGSLATPRAGLAVCVYDNQLWAMGGYYHGSGLVLDTVEAYIEEHSDWEIMPALRFPRCFASAAVCKQHLYILGGAWLDSEMESSSFSSVYDVDFYNPANKVWEGITALSIGRHDFGVAVLGPRIYIIGGKHCDDGTIKNLDTVECFDVEKDDWLERIRNLPIPLLGPAVTYTC